VAIKQIVSEHISGTGVIDIYAEAGVEQPDLSLIDEGFIDKFRQSDHPNLQIEMLKRLLSQEIRLVGKRNLVASRTFSELLASSVLRYQNHALDAAAVVAELVALARQLKHEHERGAELGLREDELAFYDAIRQNDSAVLEMGDEVLKRIAHELVDSVRRNATIDWSEKEQVRARMRAAIRRLLIHVIAFGAVLVAVWQAQRTARSAEQARSLPILSEAFREWRSAEFRRHKTALLSLAGTPPPDGGFEALPPSIRESAYTWCYFCDYLGQLVLFEIVSEEIIIGFAGLPLEELKAGVEGLPDRGVDPGDHPATRPDQYS
jgi:hypothetical protein